MGTLFCRDDTILQPCECCICSSQSRLMLYVRWRFHYPIECRIRPRRPGRQDLRPWGTGTNNCRSLQASLMPSQSLKPNQGSDCYHPQVDVELEWLVCQKAHFHNFDLLRWHRSWMTLEVVDRKLHHQQHDLHDLLLERNWCPTPGSSQNDPQVALRHGWSELQSTHFRYSGCGHWHSCWNFHVAELHKSPQAACAHRQQVHEALRGPRRVPRRVHLPVGTALSMAWPLCRLCHLCPWLGRWLIPAKTKGGFASRWCRHPCGWDVCDGIPAVLIRAIRKAVGRHLGARTKDWILTLKHHREDAMAQRHTLLVRLRLVAA